MSVTETMARPTVSPSGAPAPADVFVVFGITGDLAKVMTFHSLYRLEQRGLLDCPIVGVAVDDWTLDAARRACPRVDRGNGREARPEGVRPVCRAALLRPGGLHRRSDVRASRRGDRRREDAGVLPRDPAVPLRHGRQGPGRGRADEERDGSSSRSRSATTRPLPARSPTSCTSTSTSRSSSGSTTTSGRWASRRSSTSGSPTRCSSRSGTGTTSSASRSRWPRTSASRIEATSTTRSARSATSSSTTSCRSSA